MSDETSEIEIAEWRPADLGVDGLTLCVRVEGRAALTELASRLGPGTTFRLTVTGGAELVTTAEEILAWRPGNPLPDEAGAWAHAPVDRGDGAQAVDMLDAFLAWSKSRGLFDEAAARRISSSVQGEMAGAVHDTPR